MLGAIAGLGRLAFTTYLTLEVFGLAWAVAYVCFDFGVATFQLACERGK